MALSTGVKVGLGVLALGAVAFLVLSDPGEGVLEYAYVEQVTADPDRFQGREFKVHGIVVAGSIKQKKNDSGDYLFEIEHGGRRLKVHFTNMVPDTFQEGGEVVLTGTLNDAGDTIESDEMSAKCPSKYEEEDKVRTGAKPRES